MKAFAIGIVLMVAISAAAAVGFELMDFGTAKTQLTDTGSVRL